ncbi:unnamed protein product [Adineta steineri]|uniref:Uncharacterized protein n=1 Tax=Adineta steineri TaxID=433720 RepID=A0A818IVN7_9BILA|nr:unnamed protein product [Adineta steineri]
MELKEAKYVAMFVLFASNLIMTLIGICLQRFVLQRNGTVFSVGQRVISCLTSGVLLGILLMLILPNSIEVAPLYGHHINMGYLLVGLGFFLICIIEESIKLYETYSSKNKSKTEQAHLINSSTTTTTTSNQDNQVTRLITLVFALGVHYFFSGVLIGGQTKDTTALWVLLGAICFHMALVAFSVTLRLLVDNQNYLQVFCAMCAWSLMGSFGVYVSLLISSNSSELDLINGILQCLSAGTFVYITFIDMIHSDLKKNTFYPFMNIILIFAGFLIIVLTTLWHKHSSTLLDRTEKAPPPAPTRAAPTATSSGGKKVDEAAVNPWDTAQIWIESVTKEEATKKQWKETYGWMAEYDPKGNLKPKKQPIENSTRFSDTIPNSRGHDYGWRLQSNLGQEIQNLQIRFHDEHKKRVPKEILGYD